MSQYGNPPDPPEDGAGKPWSPYPDDWDTPKPPPPPVHSYGRPGPYAQPTNPYAAPPRGGVGNPYAGRDGWASRPTFGFGGYASWLSRVMAWLIDTILGSVAAAPAWAGYLLLAANTTTTTDANGVDHVHVSGAGGSLALIVFGGLTSLAFFAWNVCWRQGRTGATLGKSVLAIRLVRADLQPVGPGWAFLRSIVNIVNAIPCYVGYFWPIWDTKKQTFADKIMTTYVISATTI
jgi:uncharacterized RDD family membrane protein YckC